MSGFPDYFKFIHNLWRIDNPRYSLQSFTGIIALDVKNQKLVIIESKAKSDSSAFHQVKEYIDYFQINAIQLVPFFLELGKVMGSLYDCEDLTKLKNISASEVGLVVWPDNSGKLQIQNLREYDSSISITAPLIQTEKNSLARNNSGIHKDGEYEPESQSNSDSVFKGKMRYHQSQYRANVLKAPYGIGPNENSGTKFGNMLTIEDGNQGLNFITPEIFTVVKKRISEDSGAVDPLRFLNRHSYCKISSCALFCRTIKTNRKASKGLPFTHFAYAIS